jgi:cytidine deaminase
LDEGRGEVEVERLLSAARDARARAHAPYSNFPVGAAVATDAGVFAGANVENASYGLSICAERVAAAAAVGGAGARRIDAVAVAGSGPAPTAPCGACRQFLYELNPEMIVVSEGTNGDRRTWRLSELFPDPFGAGDLRPPS